MSTATKGLGRGLDALFAGSVQNDTNETTSTATQVPLASLRPNPQQPRRSFDEESLRELANSIKNQGIIQPLLVRPWAGGGSYQIVAGERRWRAAKLAGLHSVPVYIRELSDAEVMAAALIENLQREDLNPVEEAQALQALRETLHLTQEELAARLGKSRPAIANALRLLQLSAVAREDLATGKISAGHARCLLAIDDTEASAALHERILSHGLTVREAEDAVSLWREKGQFPWQMVQTEEDKPEPSPGRNKLTRKKSAEIRTLQKDLSTLLQCKTLVSGDVNKGKITLNYGSEAQLKALLNRLGLNTERAN